MSADPTKLNALALELESFQKETLRESIPSDETLHSLSIAQRASARAWIDSIASLLDQGADINEASLWRSLKIVGAEGDLSDVHRLVRLAQETQVAGARDGIQTAIGSIRARSPLPAIPLPLLPCVVTWDADRSIRYDHPLHALEAIAAWERDRGEAFSGELRWAAHG